MIRATLLRPSLLFHFLLAHFLPLPYHAAVLTALSFNPPFTAIHPESGDRMVSGYNLVGDAIVKKSFVRLTPDRAGRHGALWSEKPIGSRELAANLQFRISGQAKVRYGEGLTLWIAQPKGANPFEGGEYAKFGSFYGLEPPFVGIGIVLTTHFDPQNQAEEDKIHHKHHVMVFVNDGTKSTVQDVVREMKGQCEAVLRYYERRADFSVANTSKIRIAVRNDHLTVSVDEGSKGTWTSCAEINGIALPPDWIMHSHIGITANTEMLSDNHEVLSLKVFDMSLEHEPARSPATGGGLHQHSQGVPHHHPPSGIPGQGGQGGPPGDHFARGPHGEPHNHPPATPPQPMEHPSPHLPHLNHPTGASSEGEAASPLDDLVQHLEHQLTSIHESLRNSFNHLLEQESKSEIRIDEIERSLGDHVTNTLDERLRALEEMNLADMRQEEELAEQRITALEKSLDSQVIRTTQERLANLEAQMEKRLKTDLGSRIGSLEQMLDKRVEQRLGYLEKMVSDKITRSVNDVIGEPAQWKVPFAILAFAVVIVLSIVIWKFMAVQKQHAL